MQRQKLTLDEVIVKLESDDPEFDHLVLDNIITDLRRDEQIGLVSHIRDEHLQRLALSLKKNTTLQAISINDNVSSTCYFRWTPEGAKAVGDALKNHPSLCSAKVHIQVGSIGGAHDDHELENKILGFLYCLTGTANITHLDISVSGIGCDGGYFVETLGHFLKHKIQLEDFSLEIGGRYGKTPLSQRALSPFIAGIAQQQDLQSCVLHYLALGDQGIIELSKTLSKLKTLTVLKLDSCKIQGQDPGLSSAIADMLINNNRLIELELAFNCLHLTPIINALPLLNDLRELVLFIPQLSLRNLRHLTALWRMRELTISTLRIGGEGLAISCNQVSYCINTLINGNPYLKCLWLLFDSMRSEHIALMEPILSDPKRCQLQAIHVAGNACRDVTPVLNILEKNENLVSFYVSPLDPLVIDAMDANKRKAQDKFIGRAIQVCNGYYAPPLADRENHLSSLPFETILIILQALGSGTAGLDNEDVMLCSLLILDNLKVRREIINEGSYNPCGDEQGIAGWWRQSIFYKGEEVNLFKNREEARVEKGVVRNKGGWCNVM